MGPDLLCNPRHVRRILAARMVQLHENVLLDAAGTYAHTDHPVAQRHGLLDIMGDKDDCLPGLQPDSLHLYKQQIACLRVQRRERLVHQQNVRFQGQRTGNRHTVAHAPGKLVRTIVRKANQMHAL